MDPATVAQVSLATQEWNLHRRFKAQLGHDFVSKKERSREEGEGRGGEGERRRKGRGIYLGSSNTKAKGTRAPAALHSPLRFLAHTHFFLNSRAVFACSRSGPQKRRTLSPDKHFPLMRKVGVLHLVIDVILRSFATAVTVIIPIFEIKKY